MNNSKLYTNVGVECGLSATQSQVIYYGSVGTSILAGFYHTLKIFYLHIKSKKKIKNSESKLEEANKDSTNNQTSSNSLAESDITENNSVSSIGSEETISTIKKEDDEIELSSINDENKLGSNNSKDTSNTESSDNTTKYSTAAQFCSNTGKVVTTVGAVFSVSLAMLSAYSNTFMQKDCSGVIFDGFSDFQG